MRSRRSSRILACVCNGYAKNCTFSQELFDRTGHGSVCIDCAGNRGGPNCESCKLGFFRLPESEGECSPCACDPIGESIACVLRGRMVSFRRCE